MFDKAFTEIVDELGLQGDQGFTLDQFFEFLESLIKTSLSNISLKTPVCFDELYKSYLWTQIRTHDKIVVTKDGVIIDPRQYSFEQLHCESTSVIIKATEEAQDRSIYGPLKNVKKSLQEKHLIILNTVAKTKIKGITQFELAKELNSDAKTVFYYLKKLVELDLVVKKEVCAFRTMTNLIILKRFANVQIDNAVDGSDIDPSDAMMDIAEFKDNVKKTLKNCQDYMMSLADLIKSVGISERRRERWARAKILEMHNLHEVERCTAYDGKKKKHCVRLLSDTPETSKVDTLSSTTTYRLPAKKPTTSAMSLWRDLPLDQVFFNDIKAAKNNGLVRQDLIDKYPYIDIGLIKSFFERCIKTPRATEYLKYQVFRIEELHKKVRQYRYFSLEGFREYNRSLGKEFVEPVVEPRPSPVLVEPQSVCEVRKLLVDSEKPSRKRKANPSPKKTKPDKQGDDHTMPEVTQANNNKRKADDTEHRPPKRTTKTLVSTMNQNQTIEAEQSDATEQTTNTNQPHEAESHKRNADHTPNPTPQKRKKRDNKVAARDTIKHRRSVAILEMLEKDPIIVINQQLLRDFHELERGASGSHSIARSTFDNLIKALHDENKLTVFVTTIQKPLGIPEIKTLILHSSLKPTSAQVKEFIQNYGVEAPLMKVSKKGLKLKVVDVDTLPGQNPAQNNKAWLGGVTSFWRYTAIEYGWITSKWLRARELHEALFEYSERQGSRTVDMPDFLKRMEVRRLMVMFGVLPYHDPTLAEFLQTDDNRDIPIHQLPSAIRRIISDYVPKIRLKIIHLIRILEALGLIELDASHDFRATQIDPTLTLSTVGNVKDYKLKSRPVREVVKLHSLHDVHYYWVRLQLCCTEYSHDLEANLDPKDPLNKIAVRRGWNTNTLLSPEQKEILDAFIDRDTQTVPDENDVALRAHISKKTRLSSARIKTYYRSILIAFRKYKTKRDREAQKTEKDISPAIKELMKASLESRKVKASLFRMKAAEPFVENTFIGSRKVRRLKVAVLPYQGADKRPVFKRVKDPFTDIEKDLLVYAYCIMKTRGESSNFLWSPIKKVIPGHTPERCRRILGNMMKNPVTFAKIKKLKDKWNKYYKEGIERNEIQDEKPWDSVDFDIHTYLEYFIVKLQQESDDTKEDSRIVFPKNRNDLRLNFIVNKSDRLSGEKANHSLCISDKSMYDTLAQVPTFNVQETQIELIKILIKMILMAPEDKYDSLGAYKMFASFSESAVQEAVSRLKDEGLIIHDKSRYGRVPGRRINVSERFVNLAAGVLPYNLFQQAKEFYTIIATQDAKLYMKSSIESGTVAATLDLLSQKKIFLDFIDRAKYIKSKHSLCYPKVAPLRALYIYNNLDLQVKMIEPLQVPQDNKEVVAEKPVLRENDKDPESLSPKSRLVYESVKAFGEQGASWSDIKEHVESQRHRISDAELSTLLDQLLEAKLPFIEIAGFDCLRYVATRHLCTWLLKNQNSDSDLVYPLMWYDVSGDIIQPAMKGCAETVMSHVVKSPAISFASLCDQLKGLLTKFELYHILKFLERSKKIKSLKVRRNLPPKRSLLFSKSSITTSSHTGMNNNEITHYWPVENYYL